MAGYQKIKLLTLTLYFFFKKKDAFYYLFLKQIPNKIDLEIFSLLAIFQSESQVYNKDD